MDQFIRIDWQPSPSPISGYNVYRGNSDGNVSNIPLNNFPITDTFYEDHTIFSGQIYSYVVTAVFNGVESSSSLEIFTEPIAFVNSPSPLSLNAFAGFGLLAASTITNVPGTNSKITGDVGVFPGSSITGFESVRISGSFHLADYVAAAAQNSITTAFTSGMSLSGVTIPADLGGLRLTPGVYSNTTSVGITGTLILDGEGNPNSSWVFKVGTTLITAAANSHVVLVGGAQATNITWLVGSSATIGVDTSFAGNIIALASITVNTGACVSGRLGARTGAITLDDNSIIIYGSCFQALPPSPPNVPPSPPLAPTGVTINDRNADGISNNAPMLPIVFTTEITSIISISAVGGGNITFNGYAPVISRGVAFATSPSPTVLSTNDGSGDGVFVSSINGLLPSTTYYVRAYAINSAGIAYGNEVVFTTLPA